MTTPTPRITRKERDENLAREAAEKARVAKIKEDVAVARRGLKAVAASKDLMAFVKFTTPDPAAPNDVERSRYQNAKHHDAIASVLTLFERGDLKFDDGRPVAQLILCMPPRHGKQIADHEPVLTPKGFVPHGSLVVGSEVYAPDGTTRRVIAVGEPSDKKMRVEFTNGETIDAHPEHEWQVFDRACGKWRVIETQDMSKRQLWTGSEGSRGGRAVLQMPDVLGVDFPTARLPLDPYALGVWLGDGTTGTGVLNMAPEDAVVWRRVGRLLGAPYAEAVHSDTGVVSVRFGDGKPGVMGPLTSALDAAGVLHDKRIPEIYLRASRQQRLELLAGLMDTDGHVEAATGRCRIVSTLPGLVGGVLDLCATLGFRPYVTQQEPALSSSGVQGRRIVFTVGFQPFEPYPAALVRRQVYVFQKRRRIAVRSVTPCPPSPGRCIQVDDETGLYLVGKTLIPTHNSELTTRKFPAYFIGRNPLSSVVVASYSDALAEDFGRDVRANLQSVQFKQTFPNVRLKQGSSAVNRLQVEQGSIAGGQLSFVGRGSALTGRGAGLLILDDLLKDANEARSQVVRDQTWDWLTRVAMTRRMGKKLVVLIMTRWHSDDPVGRLTDEENPFFNLIESKNWKIINLPAIADDDDPLGRAPGEALWPDGPDKFDLDFLGSQQRLDPLGFAALYQQRPSAADGTLFRREYLRYWTPETLPSDLRIYAASDHAVSVIARRDFTVLLIVGIDRQNNIYILHCFWERAQTDRVVEMMLQMAREHEPLLWWAERGHISKSIGPFLKKRMGETGTFFNVVEVTPVGDKEQRAQSFAGRMAQGYVWLPRDAVWREKAENELMGFPNATHDDFVDACSLIGLGLKNQFAPSAAKVDREPRFGTLAWLKEDAKRMAAHRAGSGGGW